jgi:hypothetical protein
MLFHLWNVRERPYFKIWAYLELHSCTIFCIKSVRSLPKFDTFKYITIEIENIQKCYGNKKSLHTPRNDIHDGSLAYTLTVTHLDGGVGMEPETAVGSNGRPQFLHLNIEMDFIKQNYATFLSLRPSGWQIRARLLTVKYIIYLQRWMYQTRFLLCTLLKQ